MAHTRRHKASKKAVKRSTKSRAKAHKKTARKPTKRSAKAGRKTAKWCVLAKSGKTFNCYKSKGSALKVVKNKSGWKVKRAKR